MITEITKPATKDELIKAVNQRGWQFAKSIEVVNSDDARKLSSLVEPFVTRKKKLCIAIIERE
jgi:hypothetical protein